MPIVRLGNVAAVDRGIPMDGKRITTVTILDQDTTAQRVRTITHNDGLWPTHSTQPAAWVEGDDNDLVVALANYFGCPIGRPNDWPS